MFFLNFRERERERERKSCKPFGSQGKSIVQLSPFSIAKSSVIVKKDSDSFSSFLLLSGWYSSTLGSIFQYLMNLKVILLSQILHV